MALLLAVALSGCLAPERSDAELQQALAAHADVAADIAADTSQGSDTALELDISDVAEADVPAVDAADAQDDAGTDVAPDAAGEVQDGAATDAGPDSQPDTSGPDTAADTTPDVGKDTAADAIVDVAPDVGQDAAPEVVADIAPDTATPPLCQPGFVAIDVDGQLVCAADVPLWGVKPLKQQGAFTANGDGTVSDAKALLMWQASGAANTYSHAEAEAFCQAATTGGHSDWRLPTVGEWLSIVDYSQLYPSLTAEFTIADAKGFWAANANVGQSSTHWFVWLNYGYTDTDAPTAKEHALCVRCTTAKCANPAALNAGAARFSLQAGGATATDALTGLTWQVDASVNGTATWDAAAGVCQALTVAGGGWRVPNIAELLTIVDRGKSSPAIDSAVFPGTKSDWYWTATSWGGSENSEAWFVQFGSGDSNHYPKTNKHRLRCVK
ncbi:MAG: DUF1566 domain-containing protein [Deltaproteobacteria bacterium]|nr:DUF1566 domain-containing protein [Deltaproteobacteria bacterium]